MKIKLKLLVSFCLFYTMGLSQGVNISTVYFDFDKYSLTEDELALLQLEIDEHKHYQIDSIRINGHTDNFGSVVYNTQLSKNRNKTVLGHINKEFSVPTFVSHHSELTPSQTNNTDIGRKSNRRVEILWYYHSDSLQEEFSENITQETKDQTKNDWAEITKVGVAQMNNLSVNMAAQPSSSDSLAYDFDTLAVAKSQEQLNVFIKQFRKEAIVKRIDPAEDQVILTERGTMLVIQEGSFVTEDGQIPEGVVLKIEEFYDASSIISAGLVTKTADGVYLETGGMLAINAVDENGDSLELKKSITLAMPTTDSIGKKRRMKLYQEVKTKNGIQWKLDIEHPNYTKPFEINWTDVGLKALDYTAAQDERIGKALSIAKKIWLGKEKLRGKDRGIVNNAVKAGDVDREALETEQKYLFNTTGFGYINCDRSAFKDIKGALIDLTIEKSSFGKAAEMLYIIFPSINCLVGPDPGTPFDQKFTLKEIPTGIEVVVMGLKVLDGRYYMASDTSSANSDNISMNYLECTPEEFKEKINSLIKI